MGEPSRVSASVKAAVAVAAVAAAAAGVAALRPTPGKLTQREVAAKVGIGARAANDCRKRPTGGADCWRVVQTLPAFEVRRVDPGDENTMQPYEWDGAGCVPAPCVVP